MTDMSLFGIHQELSSIVNEIESLSPEEKGREGDTLVSPLQLTIKKPYALAQIKFYS